MRKSINLAKLTQHATIQTHTEPSQSRGLEAIPEPEVDWIDVVDPEPESPEPEPLAPTEPEYYTEVEEMDKLDNFCDSLGHVIPPKDLRRGFLKALGLSSSAAAGNIYAPFLNVSVFCLMHWFYLGSNLKLVTELDCLVKEVILAEDFDLAHLKGFSTDKELGRLDDQTEGSSPFAQENRWKKSTIKLALPSENMQHSSENAAPVLEIPNVYHHSLVETIVSAFKDKNAQTFHYTPFHQFWKPTPPSAPERTISELYNSDTFYDEHVKIMQKPTEPVYLLFGNQSKYARCKLSSFAANHVAYIPSLPKNLQDFYMKAFKGEAASKDTITHLKCKLMHEVWLLLLDADFMHAYEHGIIILIIWKRFYCQLSNILQIAYVPDVSPRRTMTKLAARDYEDLLQCSMPVFEGLLPSKEDALLQDLLFRLCTWHTYAKLHLHTTSTLSGLKATTWWLGKELCHFVNDVCSQYNTKELPTKEAARTRKAVNKIKKGHLTTPAGNGKKLPAKSLPKMLNLFTYKLHALGDYVATIWWLGPLDGYSTQLGELEHKHVKRFYLQTNKNHTFEQQISQHQCRERILHCIAAQAKKLAGTDKVSTGAAIDIPANESEMLMATLPEQHHHMASSKCDFTNILQWLDKNEGDPVLEVQLCHLTLCSTPV
ncbi:hypothetical protein CVT25_008490 [Psilocybe cyanescens]|uniref:Uncharacterized protein n=1 Tax=Psilocybe cyanescens TaxID=93625 RepID=A0A409XRN2_PSICY|nr:hypothetical protein CVT25_008490 [Psilocybe cyanescens]